MTYQKYFNQNFFLKRFIILQSQKHVLKPLIYNLQCYEIKYSLNFLCELVSQKTIVTLEKYKHLFFQNIYFPIRPFEFHRQFRIRSQHIIHIARISEIPIETPHHSRVSIPSRNPSTEKHTRCALHS